MHIQFYRKKGKGRFLKTWLYVIAICIIAIIWDAIRGELDLDWQAAAVAGGVGVVMGLFGVLQIRSLFRRGIFTHTDKSGPLFKIILLFVVLFSGGIIGVVGGLYLPKYFPDYNFGRALKMFIIFYGLVGSTIIAVGTYWLERRYGEKFYIAKRK